MTSAQDRANIHRGALDKWTKREQLCLASAVSCSGDQNWMTVSRSLKLLCGAQHPPDWFSQKHCAVKYGELLENVETPKRKKRTTSDNASSVVETPTDLILRRLTEERIQELKYEIREQQETYAKLYTDVVHLQTGNSNEEQIRAMWMEIEREQEQDRQLKARKQMGGHDIQRNWRQAQFPPHKSQMPLAPSKQEQDMDIDETCKPQGTSPLLSSLLQSTSSPAPGGTTTTTSTARVNAPTITNLLTGGVISSSASSSSASSPVSVQTGGLLSQTIPLSKPLTGPAPNDNVSPTPQTVLSPSQSAPTLSMLLEKNKATKESPQQQASGSQPMVDEVKVEPAQEATVDETAAVKNEDESTMDQETTEDEQQLMEVFKNLMPENIEEFADMLTNNNGILNPGILEEESILEGVESLMDETQEVDEQLEAKLTENETTQDSKNPPTKEDDSGAKLKTDPSTDIGPTANKPLDSPAPSVQSSEAVKDDAPPKPVEEKPAPKIEDKIETISSDDSSDNVPLATHAKDVKAASIASVGDGADDITKDHSNAPKLSPIAVDDGDSQPEPVVLEKTITIDAPQSKTDDEEVVLDDDEESNQKDEQPSSTARKGSISDSSDVIIIPTDDESNEGKVESTTKPASDNNELPTEAPTKDDDVKSVEEVAPSNPTPSTSESPFSHEQTITSICLPDTDDDSSTFEAPTTTPKDDKSNPPKQQTHNKKQEPDTRTEDEGKQTIVIRKLRDRDRSESPLVEDDTSDHSVTARSRRRYSSTPVMDSIPNSPASSDDREFKVWKKSLMTVYNNLLTNKNAAIFLRPFSEEQCPRYKQICLRPMDMQIIKRHIENGSIRNISDFQRDVFLMCNNAIMMFKKNSPYANMAKDLMNDFVQLKDQVLEAKSEKEKATPGVRVRGSARKSQRLP